jgi:hypothetical protein
MSTEVKVQIVKDGGSAVDRPLARRALVNAQP